MPSQIFIYIIAIILFAFILLYGYNAIRDFTKKAEDVTYLKFVSSLENTIKQNSGYGDVEIKKFTISSGYEKICFVDLSDGAIAKAPNTCLCNRAADCPPDEFDPVICDGWKDRKQNVFLVPPAPNPIKVWNATVDGDGDAKEDTAASCGTDTDNCYYLCLPIVNGKIDLRFEGKGNRVMVSKAPVD